MLSMFGKSDSTENIHLCKVEQATIRRMKETACTHWVLSSF